MNIILAQVLNKIEHIRTHGVPFNSNGPRVVRARLLMCVFDLPARASATNFVQFNGYHSCIYCSIEGIFLPGESHEPRTTASIKRSAEEAEKQGQAVLGVKGTSILSSFINIVDAVPVDYI